VKILLACLLATVCASASAEMYVQLDGQFYRASGTVQYFGIGSGQYALTVENVQMAVCMNAPNLPGASIIFMYGYVEPPIAPIKSIRYATYSGVGVLTINTVAGQAQCMGQVPAPRSYDRLFADGFDGIIFADGFEGPTYELLQRERPLRRPMAAKSD
jgi:hypothetical protein